ncbi:MAG: NirD/YgiW/YdeI family stress tolerance protein [Spirochaetaceae bacterium]|jgi:uncharacterized protein YdeI (BOF family)|nr:NirD/YgiW/YdeI family stress tolerance protein [Spirochaetaceae bacterium]
MKSKIYLFGMTALMLVFGAAALHAGDGHHKSRYWYSAPDGNVPVSTIAQAKDLPDHSPVAVQVKVVRYVGKDLFEVNDGANSATVTIDDHFWHLFNAGDTVTLYGELDKNPFGFVIHAHHLVKQ